MTEIPVSAIPPPVEEPLDDSYPPFQMEKDNLDLEKSRLELENQRIRTQIAEEALQRSKIDNSRVSSENQLRTSVQDQVWRLIYMWLGGVFLILFLSGMDHGIPLCQGNGDNLSCTHIKLHYESPVLVALISSPTVAIIGLAVIVLKYLFPNGDGKQ